ncbi:hypothetical protein ACFC1R_13020 [Kitasatospora sp. NPDC056138]|uniref:hypothetical protein n=1 Tax=Kitasatospora sp. NPDC056138 TaxID=3345724 RepID=UPI0035DC441F
MLFDESWFSLSECPPGTELFRSDRCFKLLAHMGFGRRQTLFRAVGREPEGEPPQLTDLLFDETYFLRVHNSYDGLVVRTPTVAEAELIRQEMPPSKDFDSEGGREYLLEPVVLESAGKTDYLVAETFLWCQTDGTIFDTSPLAGPYEPDGPPWRRRPLVEFDGGVGATATIADVREVLEDPEPRERRQRYRHVFVVMYRDGRFAERGMPRGVFLTQAEAEVEAARQRTAAAGWGGGTEWWVEDTSIAV